MTSEACFSVQSGAPADQFEFSLQGEIDLACREELRLIGQLYAESTARDVIADLSRVTYFDSTGLALMVELEHLARARNGKVILRGTPHRVHRVFELAGVSAIFTED